jgi:hypothetical protein
MKLAKLIALAGLLAMTAILIYAFTAGDFAAEGARLIAMPWGIVSLVDLYTGFALFSCWIAFRERAFFPALLWIILMMVMGFWAGALYVLLALQSSRGDWDRFFYGRHTPRRA